MDASTYTPEYSAVEERNDDDSCEAETTRVFRPNRQAKRSGLGLVAQANSTAAQALKLGSR